MKFKATETKRTMSELVNDALKASLQEDLEDIKSWEERKGEILTITKNFLNSFPERKRYPFGFLLLCSSSPPTCTQEPWL